MNRGANPSANTGRKRGTGPTRIGRYIVHAAFARGGMASVHLGRVSGDASFSRVVAIKRMHPLFAESEEHYLMLKDEARILSRIRHPNVVPLLDVVQDDGELCLVMDYVSGASVADLLREANALGERIPSSVASAIVCDLLHGLHAAHEARAEDGSLLEVVHRDVSPRNVIVGRDGITRVLDFGIAKAIRKEHRTMSGDLKGTLAYMAPEQLRGLPATRQSDLFSTGIMLWELLTGSKLHPEGDGMLPSILELSLNLPAPSTRIRELSRALDNVVLRAVASEPRERFGTAEEMAIALAAACPAAGREQVTALVERLCGDAIDRLTEMAREVEKSTVPAEHVDVAEPKFGRNASPARPRIAAPVVIAAIAAAALAAGISFFALRASKTAPPPPPSVTEIATAAPPPIAVTHEAPRAESSVPSVPVGSVASAPPIASGSSARPPVRAAGSAAARPRNSCTPPFHIDDAGVKLYKPECL